MSFLWLHIFITKYIAQYLKRVKRVGRTLSQEIFKKLWNNFDFVPPMNRLSQIFLSGQKIHFYWKCLCDMKMAELMDSTDG